MSQQHTIGTGNTTVANVNGCVAVTFHQTAVVVFNDKIITLDTGGFFTVTTKTRMNQTSNEFRLGFHVYAKNRTWFVDFKGETLKFDSHLIELIR